METVSSERTRETGLGGVLPEGGAEPSSQFEDRYDEFCVEIDLLGPSYEVVRRATFYSILGEAIKGGERDDKGVVAVNAEGWVSARHHGFSTIVYRRTFDTRLALRVFIYPGHGKSQVEEILNKCANAIGHSLRSPNSYHSEQFVGKVLTPPNVQTREVKFGFLAYDMILINEAKGLWTHKGHSDTRKHIRTACDPIGENDIEKENVDARMGEKVHYYPAPTTVILCQPCTLDYDLIALGDLRRGPVLYVPNLSEEEEAAIDAMFHDLDTRRDPKASERLFQSLKELSTGTHHWNLQGSSAEIEEYHRELKAYARGLAAGNASAEAYVDTAGFDLLYWFLKMVCIRAAVGRRDEPNQKDFEGAFSDLKMMLESGISFVNQFIRSEGQHPSSSIDKRWRFLEIVWKYRGHDKEYICERASNDRLMNQGRSITEETALKHYYYKLCEKGLINKDRKSVDLTAEGRAEIDLE